MKKKKLFILLSPTVVILALISLYPFFYAIYISTTKASIATIERFVGFSNYLSLFSDFKFINSLKLTILFIIGSTAIQLILGVFIAMLLNREGKIVRICRLILVIPMMITPIVIGIAFRFMFNLDYGIINYLLNIIRIGPISFLGNSRIALISLMLVDSWQWTPFIMLTVLAGLRSLPEEPFEAASIDGASRFQLFRFITLPLLAPMLSIALLIRTIDSFKAFEIFFATTEGGPAESTNVLSLFIYKTGFRFTDMGYASAAAVLMLIIIIIISNLYIRVLNRA